MKAAYLILIIGGLSAQALAQTSQPALISVPTAPTVSASGDSYAPLLSPDRRYVVFLSNARNLVAGDNLATYLDVFRHDLQTGETMLISRASNATGGANADSIAPSISSNAQWIAFASAAGDLLPGSDSNSGADIFLVDANSVQRSLVTVGPEGNSPPNPVLTRNVPLSYKPRISANGRWIAFESFATNLTAAADVNDDSDVFVRDTLNNQTVLISIALDGGISANTKSEVVSITADGNYVLFSSAATNLVADSPTNSYQELYLRNIATGVTTWIRHSNSIPFNGPGPAPYNCRWASMSRNGDFVLYKVEFASSTNARVHLYDRQADSNILVTATAAVGSPVHMSSDARFIAYDDSQQVFLWDRQTGTRTQASSSVVSHSPVVSEDGSIVAFLSAAPRSRFQIYYRNMANNELRRVTETLSGGPSAQDYNKSSIAMDPAGEFILFDSADDNLAANDRNFASDIFLHQIATSETRLISRAHESALAAAPETGGGAPNVSISADGNRILFFSYDNNLVPGDTNGWQDAFLRDLRSGQTFALSTNADGLFGATNAAPRGLLSANGRYAVLGMFTPATRSDFSIFGPVSIIRKDLDTGETVPVVTNLSTGGPNFPVSIPWIAFSISADSRWITYSGNNNSIMVADMQTGVHTNLTGSDFSWNDPLISSNGRYVLYVSRAILAVTDLLTGQRTIITSSYIRGAAFSQNSEHVVYGAPAGSARAIYLYSLPARTSTLVCTNCGDPSVSADGRFVAYRAGIPPLRQIELKDTLTGRTTLVTGNIDGTGVANADLSAPIISADGRFVAYTTKATNLTTDAPNGWNNVYVYDRLQSTTIRITGSSGNTGYGSGSSSRPVLGADGRTLAFQSFASDFAANDLNDARDLFLLKLGEGDTDNDGMSDSWEQTYFGTIDRDGTGDYDQDGQSDLAEYLAGTNPNNNLSVFEVLTITSVSTGQRQLIWSAQPGKSYRVEYKTELAGATWTSLGQVIVASGPTAFAIDNTANTEKRFYRVALVQ